ncbi:MAG: hypothetical protein Q7V02_00120 [Methylophilus sp.]|nr:hypothetical protein [Methylophilus sp.]
MTNANDEANHAVRTNPARLLQPTQQRMLSSDAHLSSVVYVTLPPAIQHIINLYSN